jgi:A/G-specific adenine glycosylase
MFFQKSECKDIVVSEFKKTIKLFLHKILAMGNIGKRLVSWYMQNQRHLPWRQTSDPYLIWLSEIILQQTQVATGLDYFRRIATRFPNVSQLAYAPLDELLRLWQGLGYYSRARNMHFAANQVMAEYGGRFPDNYRHIASLKGVGPYTAAAIASIAYGLPHAVVDGNVFRVLARLYAVDTPIDSTSGKKVFDALAHQLLDRQNPGLHNQAVMELGALVCRPVNPQCSDCPLADFCMAKQLGKQLDFPVKTKKTQTRERFLYYFLCEDGTHLLTRKRVSNDIWKGLHELPLVECGNDLPDDGVIELANGLFNHFSCRTLISIDRIRHLLTHQVLHIRFVHVRANRVFSLPDYCFTAIADVASMAFPKPIVSYLAKKLPG